MNCHETNRRVFASPTALDLFERAGHWMGLLLIVPFRHKAIPLWQSRDLPSGIEMTVRDSRPQRRDDSGTGGASNSRDRRP